MSKIIFQLNKNKLMKCKLIRYDFYIFIHIIIFKDNENKDDEKRANQNPKTP